MNEAKRKVLKIIGAAIREYRLERGLTQDKFVELYNGVKPRAIRIKKKNLSKWEHGNTAIPVEVFYKLFIVTGAVPKHGWVEEEEGGRE